MGYFIRRLNFKNLPWFMDHELYMDVTFKVYVNANSEFIELIRF